ncbi:ABC transporter ATP-binding protein [Nafulsella turpanensis]|uniref:ABC transporter ATP-binding protein n=1 Tax=Nafulsella turpanensis TaxID=1265690 RepID=UPI00034B748E|nr:ABC transporter ATP-binding protein [Nafulsella turpanensis]
MIEIRQLRKRFEGKEQDILQEMNLSLGEGEIVGLVGSSGSGKTTLLRLLAGLEEPSAGTILFRGMPVAGPSQQLVAGHPSIRIVHQDFELAHRLSVYENVAQKLRHLHPEEQQERALELLEVCHLGALAYTFVEQLSGGEKQRLALARTLAEAPELLLLDEPFSNLDPPLKEDIKEKLFSYIREQGIAAILVSHDPKDALPLADRFWVLEQGKLVQQGSPREVYYRSASPEVARLFGKINLVKKEVLMEVLKGDALDFLQKLPAGSVVGIRPDVVQVMAEKESHLLGVVKSMSFSGIHSETSILIGEILIISCYQPGYYTAKPGEVLGLMLKPEHLQVWSAKD